ncbi:hypothetical protein TNCV_4991131 [Trichonephila clavipes]|nr:hypothetical protein TNCV_4991131 [Trichonephila clavipes]
MSLCGLEFHACCTCVDTGTVSYGCGLRMLQDLSSNDIPYVLNWRQISRKSSCEGRWKGKRGGRTLTARRTDENKPNHTAICMVLKATDNDRCHLAFCHDEFRGPRFSLCRSERNAINIIQLSDKSTDDFSVICCTLGSKIDGRIGFAFVVFRSGVESEHFQFKVRDQCTVFVAELLCLNLAIKWITEQNSVISDYITSV